MFSKLQCAQAAGDRPWKILYVTGTLPIGNGEAFLIPEIDELLRRGCDVRIVPRLPEGTFVHNDSRHLQERSCVFPLFCGRVFAAALVEALLHPLAAMRVLALLLPSGNLRTVMKNLAVYPKGLWLARVARKWQANHIHAYWISTPATMAMIAGAVAKIPWSSTAHRVNISHNNLLRQKFARATFVRFISRSGMAMAASFGVPPPDDKADVIHVGVAIPDKAPCPAAADPPRTLLARQISIRSKATRTSFGPWRFCATAEWTVSCRSPARGRCNPISSGWPAI